MYIFIKVQEDQREMSRSKLEEEMQMIALCERVV